MRTRVDALRVVAEEIASDIYDRPSIETREEFVGALTEALISIAEGIREEAEATAEFKWRKR